MTLTVPTRIRIKSAPPLPEFRVWITISESVETIEELKNYICDNVCYLENQKLSPPWLMLELEEYELLNDSPTNLLRDGDVLVIKRRTRSVFSAKRKADDQKPSNSQYKKRKLSTKPTSSSSSTSSTSASSTFSNIDSESENSSSTESSTDTLREKKSAIISQNSRRTVLEQPQPAPSLPVPPGLGKPSTHARNRRRKLKRQAQNASDGFDGKLGGCVSKAVQENTVDDALPFFPISRNCKETPSKDENTRLSTTFIPPSERYPLPLNVFVTTVDVEDWTYQDNSKRGIETQTKKLSSDTSLDWSAIEANWNTYDKVTTLTPLTTGTIVGWKAFGLNPVTLTPEMSLLHLGRIIECISDNIRISVISRGIITFGGVVEEEEPREELTQPKKNIISEEWRLIERM